MVGTNRTSINIWNSGSLRAVMTIRAFSWSDYTDSGSISQLAVVTSRASVASRLGGCSLKGTRCTNLHDKSVGGTVVTSKARVLTR